MLLIFSFPWLESVNTHPKANEFTKGHWTHTKSTPNCHISDRADMLSRRLKKRCVINIMNERRDGKKREKYWIFGLWLVIWTTLQIAAIRRWCNLSYQSQKERGVKSTKSTLAGIKASPLNWPKLSFVVNTRSYTSTPHVFVAWCWNKYSHNFAVTFQNLLSLNRAAGDEP